MKKLFLILVFSIFVSATAFGQISVTVTGATNTTPNLSASYISFADALTALNGVTAMTGPVTLTLGAGGSETAPPTGFVIGSASLNPVLSATNTVTIVKSGGTVTINAGIGTATPTSAAPDGMIAIVGADYITIDGLTLTDGNVANPATMEFGIGLFKLSTSDGAQNNTIQNCTINMQRINNASGTAPMVEGSVGILVINSTNTAATTALTPASSAGANNNNKFYANAINSGNYGIALSGYAAPSPFTLGDTGNDIGGSSLATGNTILNFGGAPAATNPAAGVRANLQWGINISYNTINNNDGGGVNHVTTLRCIYGQAGTSANATFNNNTLTIHGGGTTSQTAALDNVIGSTAAGNTININNNTVTGDYLSATTGVFYGLWNSSSAANVNMQGNSVTNMSYSGAALAGSGVNYMIYNSGGTNINAYNNTVNGVTRTGTTGGTTIGIYVSVGTTQTVKRNTVNNLTQAGTAGTGGTVYGIQTSGTTVVCDSNTVTNINQNKTTATGTVYGIYNISGPTNENYNYNTINNITNLGTGATYGLYTFTATGTRTVSFNNINTVLGAGVAVAGINQTSSSPNIFRNKIYNITGTNAASPIVAGLQITGVGTAGIATVYNNIIGDIKAPNATGTTAAPVVRGINLTSATASSQLNISFNSVYLNAASTGANFSSCAIWQTTSATATTAALTMRGNVLVNLSTPGVSGLANAYQRSSTTLTNYTSTSDLNLFYAGAPGAQNLIFYDGTNSDQTLAAFKTRVSPREQNSVTENPVFLSTTSSNSDFLRPDSTVATFMESGATVIGGITNDYRGVARYPNAGYPNNPSKPAYAPDMGAFEFGGIWVDVVGPMITYTPLLNIGSTGDRQLTATVTDPSGVQQGSAGPKLYYRKNSGSYFVDNSPIIVGNDYTWTFTAAAMGGLAPGDSIYYYAAAQDSIGNMRTNPAGGSGINPPGSTPPPTPNFYLITNTSLSGDYTVGTVAFNRATGLNLSLEKFTRVVLKDVQVDEQVSSSTEKTEQAPDVLGAEPNTSSKTMKVEVEEEYWALSQNGKLYDGPQVYNPPTNGTGDYSAIYATISAAVTDLNSRGVSGPTRFLLTDAAYSEAATVTINITNASNTTATNTVTFKPNPSVNAEITVNSLGVAISVVSNYIIFDGANTDGGTTRNMTITNSGAGANSGALFVTGGNCITKNLNARSSLYLYGYGIVYSGTLAGNALINNCGVTRCAVGIQSQGGLDIALISDNDIGAADSLNTVANVGIGILNTSNFIVDNNTISGLTRWATNATVGIIVGFSAGIIPTPGVIVQNTINNVKHQGFDGNAWGAYGIQLATTGAASDVLVVNNSISDIYSQGDTEGNGMLYAGNGIYITSGGGYRIYYNSINLFGVLTNPDVTGNMRTAGIGINAVTGSGNLDIRNNIIVNGQTYSIPTATKKSYAIVCIPANTIFTNLDYNDYVATGVDGILGFQTSDRTTIGDWRTASGRDANSISWDPQYSSSTFLLPLSGALNGTGIPIAGITFDILDNPRSDAVANGPSDMGAYEKNGGTTTSMVHTINADGPYVFGFGGTVFGTIIITGYTADAPFDISWIHYSGMTPPNAPPTTLYSMSYDSIWVSNGSFSATSYQLQLPAFKNSIFNIADTSTMILAKTNSGGAEWTPSPGVTDGYTPGYPHGYAYATGLTSFSLFAITSTDNPLPVELASFTSNVNRNIVNLNWTTSEEQNNAGFDIERKPVNSEVWNKIGNIVGSGNSSQPKNYSFTDNSLQTGSYNYRLKQIDFNGNFQYFDLSGEVIVGVPNDFKLSQNYPNPFNPTTKIDYDLPVDSKVNLRVYDMLGREVASIVNEQVNAGYYTVQLNATNFASGTYFFRLVAQGTNGKEFVMTKKMQLIK